MCVGALWCMCMCVCVCVCEHVCVIYACVCVHVCVCGGVVCAVRVRESVYVVSMYEACV